MNKSIIVYLILLTITFSNITGQNQCVYKPKKFPSAFSQLNFDYYGFANQPVNIKKGDIQIETTALIENVIKEDYNDSKEQIINVNLLRIGIVNNLEFRTYFYGIIFNAPKTIHLGTAIKYATYTNFRPIPHLGFLMNYTRFNSSNYMAFSTISETEIKDAVTFSTDIGVRFNDIRSLQLCYGLKSQMKPHKSKTGIFVIASNKNLLLDKTLLLGILFTNNKTFNTTFSYGITEDKSLFKAGFTLKLFT